MKKTILLATIILFAVCCSAPKKNTVTVMHKSATDSLTNRLQQLYDKGYFNGFGVAIVDEQGVRYKNGFGYAERETSKAYTVQTIQSVASVSKTLVGIALLKAQELGKLRLDDQVNRYLPFEVLNPYYLDTPITIRQLATHTSTILDNKNYLSKNYYLKPDQNLNGLPLVFDDTQILNPAESAVGLDIFTRDRLAFHGKWYMADTFLNKAPGTQYEYSNTGTTLAAYIIERASGEPFDVFTQKHILTPLQLKDSGWKFDATDLSRLSRYYQDPKTLLPYYSMSSYPDGGFMTTINDLSKYLQELIRGYNGKGTILSKESYREFFKPQLSAEHFTERNTQNPYSESYNTGIFIGFGYSGYIGHTGGDPGVMAMLFFDPKTSTGRIMMFNTNFSTPEGNQVFYQIWDALGH
ncbi:beta-lactamase family protein [Flavobacterium supellecticarium]|uniref:Beta-lactamase family protein n=1 Tax=Flavobacterium supellecticarium TaxID=2565924 RepID=A0A4S3ZX32_9FLAO|nr:serine hydrolase domain-containing protein [Flavobacterium supellecticarium]THF50440.1 beta-lactamase family protein [Flavobacterium supellecticarium]